MSGMTSCNCELQNINARAQRQTGAFGATSPPTWEHRHAAVGEARSKLRLCHGGKVEAKSKKEMATEVSAKTMQVAEVASAAVMTTKAAQTRKK